MWFGPEPEETWVAGSDDGALLGTYHLGPNHGGPGSHIANASYMVAPTARGRGVGRAMVEHSLDRTADLGYEGLQFNAVAATNRSAIKLYHDVGFVTVGVIPRGFRHPSEGLVDLLIMYHEREPESVTATDRVSTRRLLSLAASAFVVLAAEPLYLLVDTAVVGHLGSVPLAGLGVASALMALLLVVGSFVEYGTTGRAARWYGAGRTDAAVAEGMQASWLGIAIGLLMIVFGEVFAHPLTAVLSGGTGAVQHAAESWFRIAVLGMPGVLLVLAGNGWMRGIQETRVADPHRAGRERAVGGGVAHPRLSARFRTRGLSHRQRGRADRWWRAVSAGPVATPGDRSRRLVDHARPACCRPRPDSALGGVSSRVPHGCGRRGPHGGGTDRRASDRHAAVGVHRAAAGLPRDCGAVARRGGAGWG